jgi:glutathione S-transferase
MLKIYGTSRSRAARALWVAEELGLTYEHIPVAVEEARNPEFLKVNPNGRVPAIDDDGTALWESMAINLYLAEKHGRPPLWPTSVADRGRVFQWTFWSMMECEAHFITLLSEISFRAEDERDQRAIAAAYEALRKPLRVLDDHLRDRPYLLGQDFTLADLNVVGVLILGTLFQFDLSTTQRVKEWLDRCLGRPAMQRALALP